jgi:hypothetical protein
MALRAPAGTPRAGAAHLNTRGAAQRGAAISSQDAGDHAHHGTSVAQ